MKKIIYSILIISILVACQKEQISMSTDAHDVFFLKEDGVSIPIQVHGNVASKKMLVIIHGGPGGLDLAYRNKYVIENVEKEFAVVYFDQRFAGASQGNNPNADVSLFKSDVKKVLQLLKSRYGNDTKLYLMGHSWGGFLTPYFLQDGTNQDMVKGWIQVDGAHNYYKNDSLTKEMLLLYGNKEIVANRNNEKWQEIVDYCNAHAYNESFEVGTQLNSYAGVTESYITAIKPPEGGTFSILTGNNVPLTATVSNLVVSVFIKKIDRQAYSVPISENLYKIKLPTLLLWGRHDFVCPIGLKDDIKKNIGSTDVSEKIFEQSGHSPMDNETEAFWTMLVSWVKKH